MERITAGLIVLLCTITAIGNWVVTPKEVKAESYGSRFSLSTADLAEVEVYGQISGATGTGATSPKIVRALRRAADDGVKGILVSIDSPGGSAAASQEVFEAIWRIREEKKIPVVCSMGDTAASGGYYIAAATDEIVANRATLTGSIGVIMYLFNAQGLMQKIGVQAEAIKTGPFKDIASPFRPIQPAERQLLEATLTSTYDQFLGDVARGRKMPLDRVKSLAGGRIYTGEQAKQVGLVDSLGTRGDALRILAKRAGITGEPTVQNYSTTDWKQFLRELPLMDSKAPLSLPGGVGAMNQKPGVPLTVYEP